MPSGTGDAMFGFLHVCGASIFLSFFILPLTFFFLVLFFFFFWGGDGGGKSLY